MRGVAGVLALVLGETAAGAGTFTWVSPLWTETKRSYFTLWSVLTTLLYALADRHKRTGLATLCLGGGNAVALSVELL